MPTNQLIIPSEFLNIKYNSRIIPNGKVHDIATTGANCQVFAYHLLRFYNFVVPDFRSSELWEDTKFSTIVTKDYEPLDLLFFHKKKESYGAHIAVYIGHHQAIHHAKKIGQPVIWDMDTFFEYPEYKFLLGGKRFFEKKKIEFLYQKQDLLSSSFLWQSRKANSSRHPTDCS